MAHDLEFERPLAEIDKRIQGLQRRADRMKSDERIQLHVAQQELEQRTRDIYKNLTPWQRVQVARHRDRPYTADYIKLMCDDFFELRGDRRYRDDRSIIGGLASIDGKTIMLLGHQKGRDTKEKEESTFGMAHPEGCRKAQRMMRHAERMHIPVVTLIDTPGAFPGLEDEERGIAEAIAENLLTMSMLRTPIVTVVIGEGGSGGALAIGVADRILMLENAIYTVASPEAAASIIFRDAAFAADAAEAQKITAVDLLKLKLIDKVIPEPLGGAHRDHRAAAAGVKDAVMVQLADLERQSMDSLLTSRYDRYRAIGALTPETVVAASN